MPNSKSSLAANEKTYSSDYLMKEGIDAFTTNQAFSRVIELTADNFLLPYSWGCVKTKAHPLLFLI